MNKIYNELLEIRNLLKDSGQKIDSVSNSNVANNVNTQIQNNYSLNTFNKPIKNYKKPIDVKSKTIFDKNSFYSRLFITIIFAFNLIVVLPLIYYFLTNDKDITLTSISIIYLIFIFYIGYKFFRYFLNFNSDNLKLILDNNKLILEHENGKDEEIYFINIRSFLKEKFIFSYQFFIYEDDELEPKIKFSTTSIHTAIAIEELLKFKINEATKKEKI
ncbi:hypothetical protein [Aliarcobacter cryaerophilus]|uniref:hypothetical protein n=1 Tax=Aliarcobacter cryaerophilus TaxID=28198 RepID=UPI003DA61790